MLARSTTVAWVLAALASAWVMAACSSSSPASTKAPATSDDGCGVAPVSFQRDVIPVFAGSCTSTTICHGQTNDPEAENLYLGLSASDGTNGPSDLAMVYAGLVGTKSIEDPSMNIVSMGDLENSFLWHKVEGDENSDSTAVNGCQPQANGPNPCSGCLPAAPCGVQMPSAAPSSRRTCAPSRTGSPRER